MIYILNSKIIDQDFIDFYKVDYLSKVKIGNSTILDKIVKTEYTLINNIDEIKEYDENVTILTLSCYNDEINQIYEYIDFIESSSLDVFIGHSNCYIFKGNLNTFINKENYLKIDLPDFITDLSNNNTLIKVIKDNLDTRHFNSIKLMGSLFTKTSKDKNKLKLEFTFLKSVPEHLKSIYAEVFEYDENETEANYTLQAYNLKDVAYQFLSNTLSIKDFKELLKQLKLYFENSKIDSNTNSNILKEDFKFLIKKNIDRLKSLQLHNELFKMLNDFSKYNYQIDIDDFSKLINDELYKHQKEFLKTTPIFSHGDLCFSNILFDSKLNEIKLIDPRGYENQGVRSPYYDAAKLSHSYLGKYDLIINKKSSVLLDSKFKIKLEFHKSYKLKNQHLLDIFKELDLNTKLIRLIESSLFLSMLTLHSEDKLKCIHLYMRSQEVFQEYLLENN